MTAAKFSRVYIEISNICNLQCDFCPEVERGKKVMSQPLFEKIIDQVKPLTDEVTFHLMGEPLAHPQFSEFVAYCEKQKVPVNITTNGTLLNHKQRIEDLLSPTVRQVNFSLQSFTSNYPGQDVQPYLENIFAFTKRAFKERPDLYINYRLWNITSDQNNTLQPEQNIFLDPIMREFEPTSRDFGNWENLPSSASDENTSGSSFSKNATGEALALHASVPPSRVDVAFKKSRRLQNRLYLHFDSRFEWPSLKAAISSEKGYCYGLKSHFAIHADGTVVPCCLDKEAGVPLGRVATPATEPRVNIAATAASRAAAASAATTHEEALTVLAALNSQRAKNLRDGFNQFELREELCKRCTFIRRFDSKINRIPLISQREVLHDNSNAFTTLGP